LEGLNIRRYFDTIKLDYIIIWDKMIFFDTHLILSSTSSRAKTPGDRRQPKITSK